MTDHRLALVAPHVSGERALADVHAVARHHRIQASPGLDAVEEAICFGWIDGFEKGMDDQRYAKRFTPRRQKSLWTETNIERARKMMEEGKMTEAGRATLPKGV